MRRAIPAALRRCLVFWILIAPCVHSATVRVPQDRPTIQEGIDAAAHGDTVLIADGTYAGPGNINLMFRGVDITLRSEHGNQSTVIDCESKTRAFFVLGSLTEATVIEGLAIVNGMSPDGYGGGGMFVGGSSPTILDCRFAACHATATFNGTGGGGAIIFHNSRSQVLDSEFIHNTAGTLGGAMVVHSSSQLEIRGCRFEGNRAIGNESIGGAIAIWPGTGSGPRISHCELSNNEATGGGGAIIASETTIDSCVVRDNRAEIGGGVDLTNCVIANSLLTGNVASLAGGGYAGGGWESRITDCVIERNSAVIGGGIRLLGKCMVTNSLIAFNSAEDGGGASCRAREPSSFINCTIAMNSATRGSGMSFTDFELNNYSVSRSIIFGGVGGAAIRCTPLVTVVTDCTNIYANEGGDWVDCVEDQLDVRGNLNVDPGFCQSGTDWHVCSNSPCAPEQSGECGLIGAFPVGCGVCGAQALTPCTWGQIKYQVRRPSPTAARVKAGR